MIIYRFEKNGIGPYVGGCRMTVGSFFGRDRTKTKSDKKYALLFTELANKTGHDRHKKWQKAHSQRSYLFGCPSKAHLRAYFGTSFKQLFQSGYRIKRYRVPDSEVIDMGMEVAFPVKYHKLHSVKGIKKAHPYYS